MATSGDRWTGMARLGRTALFVALAVVALQERVAVGGLQSGCLVPFGPQRSELGVTLVLLQRLLLSRLSR